MLSVILVNLLAVALAHMAGLHRSNRHLKAAFGVIALFLALRYDFGTDYQNYARLFQEQGDIDWTGRTEIGWQLLCVAFRPMGFFAMIAALALFNCIVYYRFVRDNVPPSYYGFALFVYAFDPYFMLVHLSGMRQSAAIALFLVAVEFIAKREPLRFVICVALASTLHWSAIALVPLYVVAGDWWKLEGAAAATVFAAFLAALLLVEAGQPLLDHVVAEYATRYESYRGGAAVESGLGMLYRVAVLALLLTHARGLTGQRAVLFKLAALAIFATPLGLMNSMAVRLGFYLAPALIVAVPMVADRMADRRLGRGFLVSYAVVTLYIFYSFYQSPVWLGAFDTYRTILSAPGWM